VLKDGRIYRMYYRGGSKEPDDREDKELTCYAESFDGIHWLKPNLGLHEFAGSKDNNIIIPPDPVRRTSSACRVVSCTGTTRCRRPTTSSGR
jgi:hypothetical protein